MPHSLATDAEVLRSRAFSAAVFVLLAAAYWVTRPTAHAVATDAYLYALAAQINPLSDIFDTRMILFHMANRLVWLALDAAGLAVDGFTVVNLVTVTAAAGGIVMMAHLLMNRFRLSPQAAWLGAGFLGASFGYWQYAGVAEVYTPAIFVLLAIVNVVLAVVEKDGGIRGIALCGALAGIGVLVYQPLAIPLFVAMPVAFAMRGRSVAYLVYGACGVLVVFGAYALALAASAGQVPDPLAVADFAANRFGEFEGRDPYTWRKFAWAFLALGHDIAATTWWYGIEPLAALWAKLQPARDVAAETLAAQAGRPLIYASLVLYPLLAAAILSLFLRARQPWRRVAQPAHAAYAAVWALAILVIHTAIDPRSTEAWILALPPLAIVFAVFVLQPAIAGKNARIAVGALALLIAVNLTGGIWPLKAPGGDLNLARSDGIVSALDAGDTVVFDTYDERFENFLLFTARIHPAHPDRHGLFNTRVGADRVKATLDGLIQAARDRGGRILMFSETMRSPRVASVLRNEGRLGDEGDMETAWRGCAVALRGNARTILFDVSACLATPSRTQSHQDEAVQLVSVSARGLQSRQGNG